MNERTPWNAGGVLGLAPMDLLGSVSSLAPTDSHQQHSLSGNWKIARMRVYLKVVFNVLHPWTPPRPKMCDTRVELSLSTEPKFV